MDYESKEYVLRLKEYDCLRCTHEDNYTRKEIVTLIKELGKAYDDGKLTEFIKDNHTRIHTVSHL